MSKYVSNKEQIDSALSGYDMSSTVPIIVDRSVNDIVITDDEMVIVVTTACEMADKYFATNDYLTIDRKFVKDVKEGKMKMQWKEEEEQAGQQTVGDDEMAMVQLRSGCEKPNGMYATGRESSAKKPTPKTNKPVEEPKPLEDIVNHPNHYTTGGIECIDGICAALTKEELRGYLKGNIIKYVWRERNKAQLTDLRKAQWYLNRLIKEIQDENSSTGNTD